MPLTQQGHLELVNGICLAAFRKAITPAAQHDALASLDEDLKEGRYTDSDAPWRAVLRRAQAISRAHVAATGCRSLDVLHVAAALELALPRFATFDQRQRRLARGVGLRIIAF